MDETIKRYRSFLSAGKTERECVKLLIARAEESGYKNIEGVKEVKAGDRVYYCQYGKSLALFQIGSEDLENGMNILGGHIDSPRLDIKMNPLYEDGGLVFLNTHYYGGIKKYQWVTMPLAIHGVVVKKDGSKVEVVLGEDEDGPSFCIYDLLPHIAQEQMKQTASEFIPGESLDLIVGLDTFNSKDDKEAGKKNILKLLKDRLAIEEEDLISAELEIVPAGRARIMGLDESMVLSYGQDDRVCSFTSFEAMVENERSERTSCCLLADKEEIGSVGATGMDSRLLENALAEVYSRMKGYSELKLRRALRNSMMLSSDVNSAFDPQNGTLFDKQNASYLGKGVVFNKYTGSRGKSGASDASAEFIAKLRNMLDEAKIDHQFAEMAKVDVGGGGTIAKFAAWYGMLVIDCGVAVLSMHSPWEITAVKDILSAKACYKEFLKLKK